LEKAFFNNNKKQPSLTSVATSNFTLFFKLSPHCFIISLQLYHSQQYCTWSLLYNCLIIPRKQWGCLGCNHRPTFPNLDVGS